MLDCVSAPHTHTHMSQLSVPSRPPGARVGCHTLFSSTPLAFFHLHHPSVKYTGTKLIHNFTSAGFIYMTEVTCKSCTHSSPACSYCILLYGTIMIWQAGLGSPLLSSPLAEYINAAYITGLLKQTDRYLIWEANPKQYTPTPLSWLSWLYNWLTDCSAGEKQWGSKALMPRCRLLIHFDCQQSSLILWSPLIPVGIDCVEYLSVLYHTHLPAFLSTSAFPSQPTPFMDASLSFPCRFLSITTPSISYQCINNISQNTTAFQETEQHF